MANKIGLYPVPILLTEDMTDYEGFADIRSYCSAQDDNKFFFALARTPDAHLQHFSVLQRAATSAEINKPQKLTTPLRKH